jgi:hypothetical protein
MFETAAGGMIGKTRSIGLSVQGFIQVPEKRQIAVLAQVANVKGGARQPVVSLAVAVDIASSLCRVADSLP